MYSTVKRLADFTVALILQVLTLPFLVIAVIVASIDTRSWGIFQQTRIGLYEREFSIYKVKTLRDVSDVSTQITSAQTMRITPSGHFFRKFKIDELPQFWNVLRGDMSFVGPRPDTYEMYNALSPEERRFIYSVRPGITSLASVVYYDEEGLLNAQANPVEYYNEMVRPEKVRLNIEYVEKLCFTYDFILLWRTFLGLFSKPPMPLKN